MRARSDGVKLEGEQALLRVWLRNTDRSGWWRRTVDLLLQRAMEHGLCGATVLQGELGLDSRGEWIRPRRWALVQPRPLLVECLDAPAVIGRYLTEVAATVPAGTFTLERAHVLVFRRRTDELEQARGHVVVPPRPDPAEYLPDPQEFPIMRQMVEAQLLRIFVDDTDQFGSQPLYEAILAEARRLGLSNAVVLRTPLGFGTHRRLHSERSPDYLTELPVLIEIVDTAEQIARLLPFLDQAVPEGLITIEGVKMLRRTEPD